MSAKKATNLKVYGVDMSNHFKLPNPGLRAYFGHVQTGQPDEYRTPFYKGKTVSEVLKLWMPKLEVLKDKWPSLYEFESDAAEKVGPMSVMKPLRERLPDIKAYYDLISLDQVPLDRRAIVAAQQEWKHVAGMRMRSEVNTMNRMKKSTNSGSPYFVRKSRVVGETLDSRVMMDVNGYGVPLVSIMDRLTGHEWNGCAVLGWRGQEGGPSPEDVKQRVVWMFPFAVNLQELRVYQPLIEGFQRKGLVPAWIGLDAVDQAITKLFDTKSPNDLVICTDFSKFDQHFNKVCQDVAREHLDRLFRGDREMRRWLEFIYPIKYNIPLMINWGQLVVGPHGMGSGSGGTNADETLLHRTLQHEAAILSGESLNPHSQCLGDDGILSFPGCSVDAVVQAYTSHGLEMNLSKQYASKLDCVYLRRWHHTDYRVDNTCVGVYATARALCRMCEQERYYDPQVWGPKMVALRQLSILENVKWHPLREEFVKFCMAGDKYRLGLDIPGFLENLTAETQKAIDYIPDFLGYTRSLENDGDPNVGISSWWVVNYLKSLA